MDGVGEMLLGVVRCGEGRGWGRMRCGNAWCGVAAAKEVMWCGRGDGAGWGVTRGVEWDGTTDGAGRRRT